ncbi:MAG: MerR family transcriptional regulator [Sphingobacteriales bacterium]|nr:MerR family transcriptional regulator [Sphingobacteriales bacterium]
MKLIHEIAEESGVPIHTIRYYEQYGLLRGERKTEVSSNNYKYYPDSVVEKLAFIQEAKAIGFSLTDIKELMQVWDSKILSAAQKKSLLQSKIEHIEQKIRQLKQVKKMLEDAIGNF